MKHLEDDNKKEYNIESDNEIQPVKHNHKCFTIDTTSSNVFSEAIE